MFSITVVQNCTFILSWELWLHEQYRTISGIWQKSCNITFAFTASFVKEWGSRFSTESSEFTGKEQFDGEKILELNESEIFSTLNEEMKKGTTTLILSVKHWPKYGYATTWYFILIHWWNIEPNLMILTSAKRLRYRTKCCLPWFRNSTYPSSYSCVQEI